MKVIIVKKNKYNPWSSFFCVCKVFLLEMWAGKNVNLERSNTSQSRQLSFQKRLTLSSPLLCYRLCLEPWGEWAGALLAVWHGALGAAGGTLPKECFLLESQGERNWSLSRRSWIQLSNFSWHRESRKKQLKIRCVCLFFVVCFFFFPCMFFGGLIQCVYSGKKKISEKSHRAPLPPFEGYLTEFSVASVERCAERWD